MLADELEAGDTLINERCGELVVLGPEDTIVTDDWMKPKNQEILPEGYGWIKVANNSMYLGKVKDIQEKFDTWIFARTITSPCLTNYNFDLELEYPLL